ncbi:MAG: hypothetical protein Q4F29_09050 [Lachnospiraceae bacterium]|nr:hypothetical protein [Lachnospiraceae bacterium]
MLFYKKLYVGEMAEKRRFAILQKIRSGGTPAHVYLVVPAANEANLLDIYPAGEICGTAEARWQAAYQKEPLVLGIALGYPDACRLVRRMVDEVYQVTGGLDIRRYLELDAYK